MSPATNVPRHPPTAAPLQIGPNCWMVGHRNAASLLQCNTYLRVFEGHTPLRVCVDPGSQFDFPVIQANVQQLIGDLSEVDVVTLNHQDPDVVGNTGYFCEANPHLGMIVTEDTWRLVQHLQFRPGKIRFTGALRSEPMSLGPGHRWKPVATPFCHFRGALAFYDPELRTLFTGDLFGGLNQLGRVHLFAEEDDWQGIAQFHQIYMPTREVLRYAVRQIRALTPKVEVIAPQHGHVLTGDLVPAFLDRLHELLVGHDLLPFELDEKYLQDYRHVIAQLVAWAKEIMGESEVFDRLKSTAFEDGLERLLHIEGKSVRLDREGYSGVVKVFARLAHNEPAEFVNLARSILFAMCTERGLPIPPVGAGIAGVEGY